MYSQLNKEDIKEAYARFMGYPVERVKIVTKLTIIKGINNKGGDSCEITRLKCKEGNLMFLLSDFRHYNTLTIDMYFNSCRLGQLSNTSDVPNDGAFFDQAVFDAKADFDGSKYVYQIIYYELSIK